MDPPRLFSRLRLTRDPSRLNRRAEVDHLRSLGSQPEWKVYPCYRLAFGAGAPFLRAAQRAFIAAAKRARPSGVNPPLRFAALAAGKAPLPEAAVLLLARAHRARCAAAIFLRAAADIVRFFRAPVVAFF
jgi:hypothetical protein